MYAVRLAKAGCPEIEVRDASSGTVERDIANAFCEPSAIAVDSSENVYAAFAGGLKAPAGSIAEFSRGSHTPSRVIAGPDTTIRFPTAIAYQNGKVYEAGVNGVAVFSDRAGRNARPLYTIAGKKADLSSIHGLLVDISGNVYVFSLFSNRYHSYNSQVEVFTPSQHGNVPPSYSVQIGYGGYCCPRDHHYYPPGLMTWANGDPSGNAIAFCCGGGYTIYGSGCSGATVYDVSGGTFKVNSLRSFALENCDGITSFSGDANGYWFAQGASLLHVAASSYQIDRSISGPATGLYAASQVFDDAGAPIVADDLNDSIESFAATASGNVTPTSARPFNVTKMIEPSNIAVASSGKIAVSDFDSADAFIFPPGANGTTGPSSVLPNPHHSVVYSNAVAFDRADNLYVEGSSSAIGRRKCPMFIDVYDKRLSLVRTITTPKSLYGQYMAVDEPAKKLIVSYGESYGTTSAPYVFPKRANGTVTPATISAKSYGVSSFGPIGSIGAQIAVAFQQRHTRGGIAFLNSAFALEGQIVGSRTQLGERCCNRVALDGSHVYTLTKDILAFRVDGYGNIAPSQAFSRGTSFGYGLAIGP